MTTITHRGIAIRQPEVPGAPRIWSHCETDASGTADTIEDARRQINNHLREHEAANACPRNHPRDNRRPAKVHQRPARISSSSTSGLHDAFCNWLAAAERKLSGTAP